MTRATSSATLEAISAFHLAQLGADAELMFSPNGPWFLYSTVIYGALLPASEMFILSFLYKTA